MDLVLAGVKPLGFFSSREKNAVRDILTAARKSVGCRHVAHVFVKRDGERPETFISVTYPGKWCVNYALRSYMSIDPVINHNEITSAPIILHEFAEERQSVQRLINDARRFGIGKSFVSFAVMPASDLAGSVMFSFDVPPADFQRYFEDHEEALRQAARKIHIGILCARGFWPDRNFTFDLTDREVTCIEALANGRSFQEIAFHLDAPVGHVTETVDAIRMKLGCTNTMQAVSRAIALGLIEPPEPVRRPDTSPAPSGFERVTHH